jgi:hypothetical protein
MKQVADTINKCAIIRHLPDSNDKKIKNKNKNKNKKKASKYRNGQQFLVPTSMAPSTSQFTIGKLE